MVLVKVWETPETLSDFDYHLVQLLSHTLFALASIWCGKVGI